MKKKRLFVLEKDYIHTITTSLATIDAQKLIYICYRIPLTQNTMNLRFWILFRDNTSYRLRMNLELSILGQTLTLKVVSF